MKKTGVLLLVFFMLVGCNDDSNDSKILMNVTVSNKIPGRIEVSFSDAFQATNNQIKSIKYKLVEINSGKVIFEDKSAKTLDMSEIGKLYPIDTTNTGIQKVTGNYELTVEVMIETGEIFTDSDVISFQENNYLMSSLTDSSDITIVCSKSDSASQVYCIRDNDTYYINGTTWSYRVSISEDLLPAVEGLTGLSRPEIETAPMWIMAWGAAAGKGTECIKSGGDNGLGGYAQTVLTPQQYYNHFGTYYLYYYLGSKGSYVPRCPGGSQGSAGSGGTNTLVSFNDISSVTDLDLTDILLIAAGGGGGGAGTEDAHGGSGGDGAVAISDTQDNASTSGSAGGCHDGNDGGSGGNASGDGDGGAYHGKHHGDAGNDGVGGYGGYRYDPTIAVCAMDSASFKNAQLSFGSTGNGGKGWEGAASSGLEHGCWAGFGGGGYGGGGGGGVHKSGTALYTCGGGGGGSFALKSYYDDTEAPTTSTYDASLDSDSGEVIIVFNLDGFLSN